jgi:hypothetical protein
MLKNIKAWFNSRRPRRLSELLSIQFNDHEIQVVVLEKLDVTWNQKFFWADIRRVCFKDEGLYSSDLLVIQLNDMDQRAVIPIEAQGGSEFFGALTERGYFPEDVWRAAMGETGGRVHCWPPLESKTV